MDVLFEEATITARGVIAAARKAIEEGRLQALNDEGVKRDGCYYRKKFGDKELCCVIGAALPDDVAYRIDNWSGEILNAKVYPKGDRSKEPINLAVTSIETLIRDRVLVIENKVDQHVLENLQAAHDNAASSEYDVEDRRAQIERALVIAEKTLEEAGR